MIKANHAIRPGATFWHTGRRVTVTVTLVDISLDADYRQIGGTVGYKTDADGTTTFYIGLSRWVEMMREGVLFEVE